MPTKYMKYTNEMDDGRRKLPSHMHEVIREEYKHVQSQRKLAAKYNVSRKLIQIIVNPKIAEDTKKRMAEHWRDYADRAMHTIAMRKTRAKKRRLGLTC